MASRFSSHCRLLCLSYRRIAPLSSTGPRFHSCHQHSTALAGVQISHEGGDIFNYTSGRWLYNEKKRLDEGRVQFNLPALFEAVSKSFNQPKDATTSIRKLVEGDFNRVFELTLQDGLQVVARIPYSSKQPKLFATASEVATMNLVRRHGVPTPLVYGYSTDANNSVGSEYIIMEKVTGRCVGDIWEELGDKERVKILGQIVDQEAKMFDISFPVNGSVYKSTDLPADMGRVNFDGELGQFGIGPDVSLEYWVEARSQLDIPRGPATTSLQLLESAAKKELAWLHAHGKPRLPFDREYREMFDYAKVDPSEQTSSLENFLKVATITDWQYSKVLPLFLHAGIPKSIQNYGDSDPVELKKPEYPSNFHELEGYQQQGAVYLYRRRHTHFHYLEATAAKLNIHYKAMVQDKALFRKKVYQHAIAPWEGNSIPLKADLVRITKSWSEFQGPQNITPCPISFDEEDAEETMKMAKEQDKIDRMMGLLRGAIGINIEGWLPFDRYEDAVAQAEEWKVSALDNAESDYERKMIEEHWPFDDFDEDGQT